ncbi:chitin synthase-domain-containing protein [Obelidium mucronatum]|nr:chitin synthase-domain-containing protein [Obelidium mucronatum]
MVFKNVVLTESGEFIVDIPVGPDYNQCVEFTDDSEFTHLRYTAVTSQADDFAEFYSLRQIQKQRRTKIAVVCTMYNEDDQLLSKTLAAVQGNIAHLCSRRGREGWDWDANSWKDVVVVIVADGVGACNPLSLDVLSAMGCYLDGAPRREINGRNVNAHLFEFTTQVRIDERLEPSFTDSNDKRNKVVPMQTVFLLKEKNAKKINSHRWFFNGLCKVLDPEVCVLLDVGTKPAKKSFYHFYRAFERNANVAGTSGEINPELGPCWKNLVNPLVAVQNFEYKMSNILDKPLESMLGYISVLPGAFSAYRYKALLGAPLDKYFKGEALHSHQSEGKPNVLESNMYLAEDRILAFELVMKKENRYVLKHVKSATAETDVPSELYDLVKQRRRWLNGSIFASVYSVANFWRLFGTRHSIFRKFLLLLESLYNFITLLYTWFNIASIYICFHVSLLLAACHNAAISNSQNDPFNPAGGYVSLGLRGLYACAFVTTVVGSLGNKPETIKSLFFACVLVFSLCMAMILVLVVWTIMGSVRDIPSNIKTLTEFIYYIPENPNFMNLCISMLCTYGVYIVSSILYLDPWHPFTCLIQYLLMSPSYTNVLMVYAFCNIHDISWGTKGQDSVSTAPAVQSSKNEKGEDVVATELPDPNYGAELERLMEISVVRQNPQAVEQYVKQHKMSSEDHFKSYRSYVLLAWFLSNYILTYILTNDYIVKRIVIQGLPNPFIVFLLWTIAGFAGVRFIGTFLFWIQWVWESLTDRIL